MSLYKISERAKKRKREGVRKEGMYRESERKRGKHLLRTLSAKCKIHVLLVFSLIDGNFIYVFQIRSVRTPSREINI